MKPGYTLYTFEERVGALLLLLGSVSIAGIAYWYPWYLCTYHSSPDDRYGMAIMYAFPFWFIGPGMAGSAMFQLLKALAQRQLTLINACFAICGGLLALIGFSPLFMYAWTAFSR